MPPGARHSAKRARRQRFFRGDHLHPHRDRQSQRCRGSLSSSRSREAFENGHRRRIDISTFRASGYTHPKAVRASAQARKQTHAEVGNHGGVSSPLGAELMNVGPDFQAFVTRSTHLPSLPERGSWLVLFGFLRARFHGAVPLVVRMRILPGGDRLRLRG
jgi:hypothetical protein